MNTKTATWFDAQCLMRWPNSVIKTIGWNWDTPICQWKGVSLDENHRITRLILQNKCLGSQNAKTLIFPPELDILDISNTGISANELSQLLLPPKLRVLWIQDNFIGYQGAKRLILPPQLEIFDYSDHLGPYNELGSDQEWADGWLIAGRVEGLIKRARTDDGKKQYAHVLRRYNRLQSKPLLKEVCRGLQFGRTHDSVYRFLQRCSGNYDIRRCILLYWNPFLQPSP